MERCETWIMGRIMGSDLKDGGHEKLSIGVLRIVQHLIGEALLHDAPEYVIGDMISPVKAAIGPDYAVLDERLTAAVHLRFGLPAVLPAPIKAAIKAADRVSAWAEAVDIAGFSMAEADDLFGRPDALLLRGLKIRLRPPAEVRADYVSRHGELLADCTP